MDNELMYWLCLNAVEGLNAKTKLELITLFGGVSKVFEADKSSLLRAGLKPEHYSACHSDAVKQDVLQIMELCEKQNINILTLDHEDYPEMLKYINDPPLVLFVRGNIPHSNAIAVVGSRRASGYGIETAVRLSSELASAGILVVSGMARGIDTAAHCGALNAGFKTVAVLGCGVDIPYPPENRDLMERIISYGAVISEYPPGTPPAGYHFPGRNRIISGMALGTVVIEAGIKSGSLITANYALDQGREVFAVPGDITHYNSMGTNRLIKDGAKVVLDVNDILEELNFGISPLERHSGGGAGKNREDLGVEDKKIISALKIEDLYDEELADKTNIPLDKLYELLLELELKGLVKKSLDGRYRLLA